MVTHRQCYSESRLEVIDCFLVLQWLVLMMNSTFVHLRTMAIVIEGVELAFAMMDMLENHAKTVLRHT